MRFPTKNDQHLGCELGVPPFKKTPIYNNTMTTTPMSQDLPFPKCDEALRSLKQLNLDNMPSVWSSTLPTQYSKIQRTGSKSKEVFIFFLSAPSQPTQILSSKQITSSQVCPSSKIFRCCACFGLQILQKSFRTMYIRETNILTCYKSNILALLILLTSQGSSCTSQRPRLPSPPWEGIVPQSNNFRQIQKKSL